jgi:hypothetical protein
MRIVSFTASATYRFPLTSTAIPVGSLNSAADPVPSCEPAGPALPDTPAPANVLTCPEGVTLRMTLPMPSAT